METDVGGSPEAQPTLPIPDTTAPETPSAGTSTPAPSDPAPDATPVTEEPMPEPAPDDDAPSDDPLIDDFDNGNPRLSGGQREGFWFSDGSSEGDITPVDDAIIALDSGGRAAHVTASGFDTTWAVFGVNFNGGEPAPAYVQAAQYTGLQFWACTADASGSSALFVEIPTTDTSSEHDASNEDNHYRYELALTDTWTRYTLRWSDFEQTWGTVKTFSEEAVLGIQFSLLDTGFDIWVDNIEFTPTDGSTASDPPSGACPAADGSATTPAGDAGAG